MGISFEYRANTIKAKGGPIDLIFPKEGLGWDMEAFAIMKNTKKLDAAKKLADWASSKAAMMEYAKGYAIVMEKGEAFWRADAVLAGRLVRSWTTAAEKWVADGVPFNLVFVR